MSDADHEFSNLMRLVQDGSEDAARQLVEQYGEALRRAVRRALNAKLRSRFDSLDFVQLVWSSFFRTGDRHTRFAHPDDLVKFLTTVAQNKVRMAVRGQIGTQKRSLGRERSLHDTASDERIPADSQPTPEALAIARERWVQMLQDQPASHRQVVELRMQGYTCQETAVRLGLAERTVRRILKRLEEQSDS